MIGSYDNPRSDSSCHHIESQVRAPTRSTTHAHQPTRLQTLIAIDNIILSTAFNVQYLPGVLRTIRKVDIGRGNISSAVVGVGGFSVWPQVLKIAQISTVLTPHRCALTYHAEYVLAMVAVIGHVNELGSDAADSRCVLKICQFTARLVPPLTRSIAG